MTNREKLNRIALYDMLYAMNKNLQAIKTTAGTCGVCILDALGCSNYGCNPGGEKDDCALCIQRYLNDESCNGRKRGGKG